MENNFMVLLYIRTNQFSDEKIAVGLMANINEIPYFSYSLNKLNFALKNTSTELLRGIKKSFIRLDEDVNKLWKGQESLSLFDRPYSKKIIEKLTLKKRGVIQYSDFIDLKYKVDFEKVYKKFIGEPLILKDELIKKQNFKNDFFQFVSQSKFKDFSQKAVLYPENYPGFFSPIKVDLFRKTGCFTIFQSIDFAQSLPIIQKRIAEYKLTLDVLNAYAMEHSMGIGRYYLVYQKQDELEKNQLIQKLKKEIKDFELITLNEMKDKI